MCVETCQCEVHYWEKTLKSLGKAIIWPHLYGLDAEAEVGQQTKSKWCMSTLSVTRKMLMQLK